MNFFHDAPSLAIFATMLFIFLLILFFPLFQQILKSSDAKQRADKALLKELLEGFGLDLPAELKDPKAKVLKSR